MRASMIVMRAPSSVAERRDAAARPAAPAPAMTMRAEVLSGALALWAWAGSAVAAAPAASRLRKRRRSAMRASSDAVLLGLDAFITTLSLEFSPLHFTSYYIRSR